jgi:hypothetical protein
MPAQGSCRPPGNNTTTKETRTFSAVMKKFRRNASLSATSAKRAPRRARCGREHIRADEIFLALSGEEFRRATWFGCENPWDLSLRRSKSESINSRRSSPQSQDRAIRKPNEIDKLSVTIPQRNHL